jgi:hypothetical protein
MNYVDGVIWRACHGEVLGLHVIVDPDPGGLSRLEVNRRAWCGPIHQDRCTCLASDRKCIFQSNPQNFIWREFRTVFLRAGRRVELIITPGLELCKSGRNQSRKDSKLELHAELGKKR